MSKYAIVFFPSEDIKSIQSFRLKHDPKATLIPPHITLIFPFVIESEDALVTEIESKIVGNPVFNVHLKGTELDPDDDYLHFLVREGADRIGSLHDRLYSGLLEQFWRKDLAYSPHMTIGVFREPGGQLDANRYSAALKELEQINLESSFLFNNVNLIKIEDPQKPRIIVKTFRW